MLGLIIVVLLGLAIAGGLIGAVVVTSKMQTNQIADRIAQADQLISKARHYREDPEPARVVTAIEIKPSIQPALKL